VRGGGLLLLLPLAAAVPLLQSRIDDRLGTFRSQEEALYLWHGEQVQRLFPGFEGLAADVYWLRTVQYFGGRRVYAEGKSFNLLRPLIDITTSLDPRLEIAYRYGAVFLSEPVPMGAGRPQEGIEILEKGARAMPLSWRLRQDLGFFHYLYLGDATTASQILMEAAEIPGAAYWLKTLAADVLSEGGDRQSARRMWQQMYDQAEEGPIRANAAQRLQILDALDMADALTSRVAAYERLRGEKPRRLEALGQAGMWNGPLVDPAGVPFAYDRDQEDGRVHISRESPLSRPEKAKRKL
jgi:tetratricopeptide (TPR) repeat protein